MNRAETAGWTVTVITALMASTKLLTAIPVPRIAQVRPYAMCKEAECTAAATPATECLKGPVDAMRWMLMCHSHRELQALQTRGLLPSSESRVYTVQARTSV